MRSRMRLIRSAGLGLAGWGVLAVTQPAQASVLDISASITISAQELINGAPASFSQDDAAYPGLGVELPLSTFVRVESTDLEGALVAVGQGVTEFADPERLAQENPEELALEVACYSNAPDVAYRVRGAAVETRTIVFTDGRSALAPQEIQFRVNGTRDIESRLFVSGAILIWTPDLDADDDGLPDSTLDGLNIDVRWRVARLADEQDDQATTLFDSAISLRGEGETLPDPQTIGPMIVETSDIDSLVAEGLDDASAAALRTVAERGTLTILLIPRQAHAYRYRVRANEPFLLRAELSIDIRNLARGSGIAAAIGRPFGVLTDFIEHALEGASPTTMEQSINALVSKSDAGLIRSGTGGDRVALCGQFGVEIVPLVLIAGLLPFRFRDEITV